MQQTETYKLNLIDKDDTFSPDPLNDNARKLEAALAAEAQARQESGSALDNRVTKLEGHKLVFGAYVGSADSGDYTTSQRIELGFTPTFVFVQGNHYRTCMGAKGFQQTAVQIEEGGFRVWNSQDIGQYNYYHINYAYCAIV